MSGRVFRIAPERADAPDSSSGTHGRQIEADPGGAGAGVSGSSPVQALLAERAALERRIARLQESEQREARKRRELAIERVLKLMQMWSITLPELRRALREDGPAPAQPLPGGHRFKYAHPSTGETWDGTGEHPPWLRQALLQQGYTVAELVAAARALEARLEAGEPAEPTPAT